MPADCESISRKLSAYIDGELPAAELDAVKAHLASCAACSEELRALGSADAALRALPAAAPGHFFAARTAALAREMDRRAAPLRRFLRYPLPAAALLTAFILFNIFTFAFNINAMENGPRRVLARKVVAQLAEPASLINPVAVARLCGECSKYMCLCMHEAGKQSICPCKDCQMHRKGPGAAGEGMKNMEGKDVH